MACGHFIQQQTQLGFLGKIHDFPSFGIHLLVPRILLIHTPAITSKYLHRLDLPSTPLVMWGEPLATLVLVLGPPVLELSSRLHVPKCSF